MPLVPKHISVLSPYKAGKPIEEVKRELGLEKIIKLASNENPLGPSPKVLEAVIKSLPDTSRYPDPSGFELRTKLADKFNLKMENVILGAGSEGIMSAIMRAFLLPGDEIVATRNSFIGFKVLANACGNKTNWIAMKDYRYNLPAMAESISEYTKIIYLANPDNPTGSYFSVKEFDTFMEKVPDRVLVILDEAYFEYAMYTDDYPDSMHYRYDNVITLRTFSKIYGLAGFRVGYGFAHKTLISNLLKVKLPFEPSVPAQAAAIVSLEDSEYLEKSLAVNIEGMELLSNTFISHQLRFTPSVTNFLTLVFEDVKLSNHISMELLKRGVIVRNLISFGLPECIRVTIGTQDENLFFIQQLEEIVKLI